MDDSFGYWFSGLSDGEAHFQARVGTTHGYKSLYLRFSIGLRLDDKSVLEYIHSTLQVGTVHDHHRWKTKTPLQRHQATFQVSKATDIRGVLIPMFDKYPLRTKKLRDYQVWREIVLDYGWDGSNRKVFWTGQKRFNDEQWTAIGQRCLHLKEERAYVEQ